MPFKLDWSDSFVYIYFQSHFFVVVKEIPVVTDFEPRYSNQSVGISILDIYS